MDAERKEIMAWISHNVGKDVEVVWDEGRAVLIDGDEMTKMTMLLKRGQYILGVRVLGTIDN